jgi:hypothetical protein
MNPRVDEFYIDNSLGRIKFVGYEGGRLLFRNYTKPFQKWEDSGYVSMEQETFRNKFAAGMIQVSVPPK